MIHALRAAARAAVKPMVKLGRVVTVYSSNEYDVQIPGHVDAYGIPVPMRRIRSLTRTDHAVGDRVYVCQVNANRTREGALWVVLAADGVMPVQVPSPAKVKGWYTYGANGQRNFANVESAVPSALAEDTEWSATVVPGVLQILSANSFLYVLTASSAQRVDINTSAATDLDTYPQYVDEDGYYSVVSGPRVERRGHDDGILWTSKLLSVDGALAFAASKDGTRVLVGGRVRGGTATQYGLTALSTADGAVLWSNPNVYPDVAGIVLPPDNPAAWFCYSADTDSVFVRYAITGSAIQRTYINPLSQETIVDTVGTELKVHVRTILGVYGTLAADVELPLVSDTEAAGPYSYPSPFTAGACVDGDGTYRFVACSSSFGPFEQFIPGGDWPAFQDVKIRRAINFCSVKGFDVKISEVESSEAFRRNGADLFTARMRWHRIIGHDPNGDTTLAYSFGQVGGETVLIWHPDGTSSPSEPVSAQSNLLSGLGGVVVPDPTGQLSLTTVWAVRWSLASEYQPGASLVPPPIAIGKGSKAVIRQDDDTTAALAVLDTTDGSVDVTLEFARAVAPFILHDGWIYAFGTDRLYRF